MNITIKIKKVPFATQTETYNIFNNLDNFGSIIGADDQALHFHDVCKKYWHLNYEFVCNMNVFFTTHWQSYDSSQWAGNEKNVKFKY